MQVAAWTDTQHGRVRQASLCLGKGKQRQRRLTLRKGPDSTKQGMERIARLDIAMRVTCTSRAEVAAAVGTLFVCLIFRPLAAKTPRPSTCSCSPQAQEGLSYTL
eukprot:3580228-Pleurochrysis_carterae.AAC.2